MAANEEIDLERGGGCEPSALLMAIYCLKHVLILMNVVIVVCGVLAAPGSAGIKIYACESV